MDDSTATRSSRWAEAVTNRSLRTSPGVSLVMTFGAMCALFVVLVAVVVLGFAVVFAVPGLGDLVRGSDTAQAVVLGVGLTVYAVVALPAYFRAERAIGRALTRRRRPGGSSPAGDPGRPASEATVVHDLGQRAAAPPQGR